MADPNELVQRLRQLRIVLKSGEYDGADLMRAWCAMVDAADMIERQHAALGRAIDIADELAQTANIGVYDAELARLRASESEK